MVWTEPGCQFRDWKLSVTHVGARSPSTETIIACLPGWASAGSCQNRSRARTLTQGPQCAIRCPNWCFSHETKLPSLSYFLFLSFYLNLFILFEGHRDTWTERDLPPIGSVPKCLKGLSWVEVRSTELSPIECPRLPTWDVGIPHSVLV